MIKPNIKSGIELSIHSPTSMVQPDGEVPTRTLLGILLLTHASTRFIHVNTNISENKTYTPVLSKNKAFALTLISTRYKLHIDWWVLVKTVSNGQIMTRILFYQCFKGKHRFQYLFLSFGNSMVRGVTGSHHFCLSRRCWTRKHWDKDTVVSLRLELECLADSRKGDSSSEIQARTIACVCLIFNISDLFDCILLRNIS